MGIYGILLFKETREGAVKVPSDVSSWCYITAIMAMACFYHCEWKWQNLIGILALSAWKILVNKGELEQKKVEN